LVWDFSRTIRHRIHNIHCPKPNHGGLADQADDSSQLGLKTGLSNAIAKSKTASFHRGKKLLNH
jgi:hypothetical protein